jgi:hypothetical protein
VSTAPPRWLTLKELDAAAGLPKGSAFRAFKRLEPGLREGAHFRALRPGADDAEIAALRAAGRVYGASRVVILLGDETAAAVRAALAR